MNHLVRALVLSSHNLCRQRTAQLHSVDCVLDGGSCLHYQEMHEFGNMYLNSLSLNCKL